MTDAELIDQLAIHAPPAPSAWYDADFEAMRGNIAPDDLIAWPFFFARRAVADRTFRAQIATHGKLWKKEKAAS